MAIPKTVLQIPSIYCIEKVTPYDISSSHYLEFWFRSQEGYDTWTWKHWLGFSHATRILENYFSLGYRYEKTKSFFAPWMSWKKDSKLFPFLEHVLSYTAVVPAVRRKLLSAIAKKKKKGTLFSLDREPFIIVDTYKIQGEPSHKYMENRHF